MIILVVDDDREIAEIITFLVKDHIQSDVDLRP
jgi:hypothetical protein